MRLPPFGNQYFEDRPSAGIWVAIGPGAWDFAETKRFPVIVLPEDGKPSDYRWPSHQQGALIYESGEYNDDRLDAVADVLLKAGSPFVVAIREALLDDDPCIFFYPESIDA